MDDMAGCVTPIGRIIASRFGDAFPRTADGRTVREGDVLRDGVT